MFIESIILQNYRNYNKLEANFSPTLNIFIGKNAQGKTNFLEAIYFLALTRSHRTRSDKELIQFQKESLHVSGTLVRANSKVPLDIYLSKNGRITKLNHLKQAKLSDYVGNMTVVLFAPEDLQLVKGSPSLRRKFIDIDLGQIKQLYLSDLAQYNHILKQRNSYLKTADKVNKEYLFVLDEQLVHYGSRVIKHRYHFIQNLSKKADKHHFTISNELEHLSIKYLSSISFTTTAEIEEKFKTQLLAAQKRDIFKKNTGVGPHRDNLAFYINDLDASFSSQGQQRSLVLSLKLAEIDLIKVATHESPILLLDDVMSELDQTRQEKLLQAIRDNNVQTFMTTTNIKHFKDLPQGLKLFTIDSGNFLDEKNYN
ncbi:DNA replication/repair protein RecF [Streptococcus sciuri]|uniref:DNA replication and repair protein RecF n=1 Tax=Streptococcus sciuri TaxID=2973939 RepID=A0ABT2F7Y3_9STRE|nr:DNA replication/repair protein RecF [Streptococcus sciuri]MCS4487965.1 DNA replication/repair protein RecF [Streptococcus sciuri]